MQKGADMSGTRREFHLDNIPIGNVNLNFISTPNNSNMSLSKVMNKCKGMFENGDIPNA